MSKSQELSGYSADPACGSGQSQCTHQHCSILDGVTFDSYTYTTGSASFTNTGVSFAIHDCDLQVVWADHCFFFSGRVA